MERLPRTPPEDALTAEPTTDGAVHPSTIQPTDAEIAFYYRGFMVVLRKYRTLAVLGWTVVAAGFCFLLIGWRSETSLVDILLSCLTMASGVAVVHLGVTVLDTYVRIPARDLQGKRGEPPPVPLDEIQNLMNDVAAGGWQEAFAALMRLRAIGKAYGFQDLPGS